MQGVKGQCSPVQRVTGTFTNTDKWPWRTGGGQENLTLSDQQPRAGPQEPVAVDRELSDPDPGQHRRVFTTASATPASDTFGPETGHNALYSTIDRWNVDALASAADTREVRRTASLAAGLYVAGGWSSAAPPGQPRQRSTTRGTTRATKVPTGPARWAGSAARCSEQALRGRRLHVHLRHDERVSA